MRAALLYSAGKDSTLATLLLEGFYDVTLVTASFGVVDPDPAREAAAALDLAHETVDLDPDVAHNAVERIYEDGYPRNGIQQVHEHAVERLASTRADDFDAIADGTRRDDRVPTIGRPLAQSIEDRFDVEYLAPLAGFGRGAIDEMVDDRLIVETGPSESIPKADYEVELRALLTETYGEGAVDEVFPAHTQSRVRGRR
jgi:predicted subunit of tRNA(5-methylaminomethyl-2-thiouridylate) methyltransferase